MKTVLVIAYHFPPLAGSSGIQRALRFVQQLPEFGWKPVVLSASPRAYERTSTDLDGEVPAGTVVRRAFALDAARHLAIGSRHLAASARPDRWVSWRYDGVRQGMKLIRQFAPDAIWSTFPIATAHLIAASLQARSGTPWIADFRDPMAQEGYPADPKTWQAYRDIEATAIERASRCTFTTPSAARLYRERYPARAGRVVVLENGYDEESFAAVEASPSRDAGPLNPGALTLLHSGIVYPQERDPAPLVAAFGRLRRSDRLQPGRIKLRFRAAVHDDLLRALAAEHGVSDDIQVVGPVPYREALSEMLRADALLVMQAANCNEQIPAKVYEYLRARRPILCLADPAGDTEAVLRAAGVRACARLASAEEIESALPAFVESLAAGGEPLPADAAVRAASRRVRTEALAALLDAVRQRGA